MSDENALIVKYHFDELKGDTIKDDGPNNLNAELKDVNEVIEGDRFAYKKPKRTDGYKNNELDFQKALEFTGEELLKINHNQVLNTPKITVMAWVLYKDLDENYKGIKNETRLEILEKFGGYWINIRISADKSFHRIRFGFRNSEDGRERLDSKQLISPDQWHHVAGTFDGKFLRIYIDGIEDRRSDPPVSTTIAHNNHPLTIGGTMTDKPVPWMDDQLIPPDAFFYGKIDEVRIYNRALSANSIKDIARPTGRPAAPKNLRIVSSES